jgi:hypothetical protein
MAQLITTAVKIPTSSRLEDIFRVFRNINKVLKLLDPAEAAQYLQPLHDTTIFPIGQGPNENTYMEQAGMSDSCWFIADRRAIRKSMQGKLHALETHHAQSLDRTHTDKCRAPIGSRAFKLQTFPLW